MSLSLCSLTVHYGGSSLVVGEYQGVSDDHVFPPACSEHNSLGNVVWCEGLTTTAMVLVRVNQREGPREGSMTYA